MGKRSEERGIRGDFEDREDVMKKAQAVRW